MAYQIDELSLKIDIEGAKKQTANNIKDIASAIRSLNNAVGKSGALANLKAYSNSLQKMAVSIKSSFKDIGNSAAANLGKTITPPTMEVSDAPMEGGSFAKYQTSAANYANTVAILKKSMDGLKISTDAVLKSEQKLTVVKKQLSKSLDENAAKVDKSSNFWSKFTRSLGRIAMYRAIRRAIQLITQAMITGIQNFAQFDDTANKSISNIRSSVTQLKNSLGTTFGYIIQALEPVIISLTDSVIGLINNINIALASLQGKSYYVKAKKSAEDYAKSLQKVNEQLASFDKFEALQQNTGTDPSEMFERVSMPETLPESVTLIKSIFELIRDIGVALQQIWTDVVKPLLSWVIDKIKWLNDKGMLKPLLIAILGIVLAIKAPLLAIIGGIALLVTDIDGMSNVAKTAVGILLTLAGALAAVSIAASGIAALTTAAKIVAGIALAYVGIRAIQGFADGGVPEVGTMFYAGEAGAEIVSTSRSGQTGVANVEQISQAFLQALINYNAAQNGQGGVGNVYLDGSRVGQLVESGVYSEGVRVGHFKRA